MGIEFSLIYKCEDCHKEIDEYDLSCGLCLQKGKDDYLEASVKEIVKDFLKNNREEINNNDYSHYDEDDFPEDHKNFHNEVEKEFFLKGYRQAREMVKIELICDCLNYGIDLQYLFDEKEKA